MTQDIVPPGAGPSSLPDDELLLAIAGGEETALAELIRRYQGRVINLAYRYLGSHDEAELVTQDTFVRIWHHAGSYRGAAQVWTWVYRIVVNLCCNSRLRNRRTGSELSESLPADVRYQPAEAHERNEQDTIVRQALESLPEDQRMAVVLTRLEGLSYVDASQAMNKSVNAVATLLFRAKENLRTKLMPFVRRGKVSP